MREVTERDFRREEFRDADPKDYEFRSDGRIVRKDRWEMAVNSVRELVGIRTDTFEIEDVLSEVRSLVSDKEGWLPVGCIDDTDPPDSSVSWEVRLRDGSVLKDAMFDVASGWVWRDMRLHEDAVEFRESKSTSDELHG